MLFLEETLEKMVILGIMWCRLSGRMVIDNSSVRRILDQSKALSTALIAVDQGRDQDKTLKLVQRALDQGIFSTIEELTTQSAMRLIIGQEGSTNYLLQPAERPLHRRFFETVARAWMIWAEGGPTGIALEELHDLREPSPSTGALHMTLKPWKLAVEALLLEDLAEAKRRFLRSSELGSQFGTEASTVIQWSYVASFFSKAFPPDSFFPESSSLPSMH